MHRLIKTPEQKFFSIAGILGLLIVLLTVMEKPSYQTTTFVDAVPPEEFLAGPVAIARRPTAVSLSAPDILRTRKKFATLSRAEKRSLYNAVMYFCNEERDESACRAYVGHCGKPCQMLVQGPAANL